MSSKLQPGFKSPDLLLPGFSNRALTPVWFSSGSDDRPLADVSREARKFAVEVTNVTLLIRHNHGFSRRKPRNSSITLKTIFLHDLAAHPSVLEMGIA
jgi:hypothetical protein